MPVMRRAVRNKKRRSSANKKNALNHRLKRNAISEQRLSDHPELFAEIFGGSEYPVQSIRRLMAAIALVEVKDYFTRPDRIKNSSVRARIARAQAEADRYIFDPKYEPASRVFSFTTICQFLGVDPDFARRGIRERSPNEIRGIIQRMTFHRAMDDV